MSRKGIFGGDQPSTHGDEVRPECRSAGFYFLLDAFLATTAQLTKAVSCKTILDRGVEATIWPGSTGMTAAPRSGEIRESDLPRHSSVNLGYRSASWSSSSRERVSFHRSNDRAGHRPAWSRRPLRGARRIALPVVLSLFGGRQVNFNLNDGHDTGQLRMQLWSSAMEVFKTSLVFGVGLNRFSELARHVAQVRLYRFARKSAFFGEPCSSGSIITA